MALKIMCETCIVCLGEALALDCAKRLVRLKKCNWLSLRLLARLLLACSVMIWLFGGCESASAAVPGPLSCAA